jgi:hypothetical protein
MFDVLACCHLDLVGLEAIIVSTEMVWSSVLIPHIVGGVTVGSIHEPDPNSAYRQYKSKFWLLIYDVIP